MDNDCLSRFSSIFTAESRKWRFAFRKKIFDFFVKSKIFTKSLTFVLGSSYNISDFDLWNTELLSMMMCFSALCLYLCNCLNRLIRHLQAFWYILVPKDEPDLCTILFLGWFLLIFPSSQTRLTHMYGLTYQKFPKPWHHHLGFPLIVWVILHINFDFAWSNGILAKSTNFGHSNWPTTREVLSDLALDNENK